MAILIVVAGLHFFLQPPPFAPQEESAQEKTWLEKKYGQKLYSQHNEELIIRDFFQDRKNGFFVDVGASHYRINSTTFFLEKHLGWRGIAVDALSKYATGYIKNRKNTRYYIFFVSDKSDNEVEFYINIQNDRVSSGNIDFAKRYGEYEKVKVPTITLDDLLEHSQVHKIDFLSMDIELAEPAALAGFDIQKFRPQLVCIEAHPEVLSQLLEYFERNNYKIIEKYIGMDPLNLYFTPKEPS